MKGRGHLPSNSSIVRVWTESCLLPRQPVLMTCQKLSTTLLNTTTRTSSMKSQRQSGNSRVPVLCYISPWNLQCSLTVFNEFGSEGKPVGNTTTKPLKNKLKNEPRRDQTQPAQGQRQVMDTTQMMMITTVI